MLNCKANDCTNKALVKGLCKKHWQRLRRHGDAEIVLIRPLPETCEVNGCNRKPHSRWKEKAVCNMHYLRLLMHGNEDKREKIFNEWSVCCIDGCDRPSRSPGKGIMCEMHYYRFRRTGHTEIISRKKTLHNHSQGYTTSSNKDHPLASNGSGFLYEHRRILFDQIGWGPHKCHWCGYNVDWAPGERTRKGSLIVDHLNGDKTDNDIKNLVPSCHSCNSSRGFFHKWISEHQADAIKFINKQNDSM